ncbi:MAG: DUF5671 domain-containing protein [Candidatus Pacebacteria bacterium]|nr:DUF5671 domain-containing protein [Candidatus Paceibacterota bacterium]MDD5357185.1 DUF5671 domain-containing protein [Candidatus Paceibacterota bacterium]
MEPQTKTTPKDFFLNVAISITLYASTIAFLNILFGILEYLMPDALNYSYGAPQSIRIAMATLIVGFPLYIVFSYFARKTERLEPSRKNTWVRRWLTYITLFLAGAAVAVTLIVLINTFLNGEITLRFILKVLSVVIVTGGIFSYYIIDLREEADGKKRARWAFIISALAVVALLVGGLLTVGSPARERALRFDEQRIYDLQNIQYQIVNYWQKKGELPKKLSELNDSISGWSVPQDPEGREYVYRFTGGLLFDLCATFNLKVTSPKFTEVSAPLAPIRSQDYNWSHDSGYTCFARVIDTQLYPPPKK